MMRISHSIQLLIPKDSLVLLALGGFLITAALGYWQLSRAQEKKQTDNAYQQAMLSPAIPFDYDKEPKQFEPIKIQGQYLPIPILLDNQYYQHQFGYDVLTPFLLSNNQVILVDRGWVRGNPDRTTFPLIDFPKDIQLIEGQVYYFSKKSWVLGPDFEKKGKNILLIERFDKELMTKLLHKSVYPFIIRLNKKQKQGFIRDWAIVTVPASRHIAYAIQWFAMTLSLLIFMIIRQMRG